MSEDVMPLFFNLIRNTYYGVDTKTPLVCCNGIFEVVMRLESCIFWGLWR